MHWILDKKLSWVVSSTFSSTCKILLSPSAGSHTPMKYTLIPYLQWVCPAFESHLRVALGNWRELNKASLRWALPISFATLTIIWGAQKHFWKLLIFDNIFFCTVENPQLIGAKWRGPDACWGGYELFHEISISGFYHLIRLQSHLSPMLCELRTRRLLWFI